MVEEIIQVKDSIPWVRCASGNVLGGGPPVDILGSQIISDDLGLSRLVLVDLGLSWR